MRINVSLPVSLLEEMDITIHAVKLVGAVRLRLEGDGLVVQAWPLTLRFRPDTKDGKIVLHDPEVSGLLWFLRPLIRNKLKQYTENITIAIRSEKIHIAVSDDKRQSRADGDIDQDTLPSSISSESLPPR